mmetsp:Transcript_20928/g.44764  ORF Transcript_20928/g.44764 Transcript_20928/m.44764 type:complete len:96 (+) Transcript_20928:377-664(+)
MCGMRGLFSYVCIGEGVFEPTPNTALTTRSVSQVGDMDDETDASVIDDCGDSCPDEDVSSEVEGVNDGSDEEDDNEDIFSSNILWCDLVDSTGEM